MPFLKLKHFSRDEAWGEPERMDFRLLKLLDDFRDHLGLPVRIVCGTQGTHSPGSQHALGKAVDFVVPDFRDHWLDLFFEIARFPFTGIGFYPHGRYQGKMPGSWHVDVRDLGDAPRQKPRALWLGVHDRTYTKISYFPFAASEMRKLTILPPTPILKRTERE